MRQHGDGAVPLFVTELGWPSSVGKVSTTYPIATTESGQAERLLGAFRLFMRQGDSFGSSASTGTPGSGGTLLRRPPLITRVFFTCRRLVR